MKKTIALPFLQEKLNRVGDVRLGRLEDWISTEFEAIHASRGLLEREWAENLRNYNGVTQHAVMHIPFENAPNIEFTVGAMMTDALHAQSVDLTFNSIRPVTTVLPSPLASSDARLVESSRALQDWVAWGTDYEYHTREASEHVYLDNIQNGTGIFYVPWEERTQKTRSHATVSRGPRIRPVPLEDFFISPSIINIEDAEMIPVRHWMTESELRLYKNESFGGWDTDRAIPCGSRSFVRSVRERVARVSDAQIVSGKLFEIFQIHLLFDIDEDGFQEDIVVIWDRTSRKILKPYYNAFQRRPFTKCAYQIRSHLFYGLGVMDMARPFQEGITRFANDLLANSFLSNTKMFTGPAGLFPTGTVRVWPGRYLEGQQGDSISEIKMSDVNSSGFLGIQFMSQFVQQRTGVNETQTLGRPSQIFGSRTPGITAMSAIQQANKRFSTAFDGMKNATAEAVMQCQYRYQERLLQGDTIAEKHILNVLGEKKGTQVIELLKDPEFDRSISIEMAASDASVNREADRQAHLQVLAAVGSYYQQTLELSQLINSGQLQGDALKAATQIRTKASELVGRIIRTYPQIKDAERFTLEFNGEIDALPVAQNGLNDLGNALAANQPAQGGATDMGGLLTGANPLADF